MTKTGYIDYKRGTTPDDHVKKNNALGTCLLVNPWVDRDIRSIAPDDPNERWVLTYEDKQ